MENDVLIIDGGVEKNNWGGKMTIEEAATYIIIITTNFKITVNINFVKKEKGLQQYAKWSTSFKDSKRIKAENPTKIHEKIWLQLMKTQEQMNQAINEQLGSWLCKSSGIFVYLTKQEAQDSLGYTYFLLLKPWL